MFSASSLDCHAYASNWIVDSISERRTFVSNINSSVDFSVEIEIFSILNICSWIGPSLFCATASDNPQLIADIIVAKRRTQMTIAILIDLLMFPLLLLLLLFYSDIFYLNSCSTHAIFVFKF